MRGVVDGRAGRVYPVAGPRDPSRPGDSSRPSSSSRPGINVDPHAAMTGPEPRRREGDDHPFFGYGPVNLGLFVAGIAAIVAGYVVLDRGSVTAAPLLLVLGYAVLLPMAIFLRTGEEP